jgi:glucan 1,3-beta-glucosidase
MSSDIIIIIIIIILHAKLSIIHQADSGITSAACTSSTGFLSSDVLISATTVMESSFTPSAVSVSVPSSTADDQEFLRGVNIGSWLVLEKWIVSDLFSGPFSDAIDQWSFDSIPGAAAALDGHWSTFFTEADVQNLKANGINA